ncbi:MAG: vWA domain-containing protein [Candidatus Sericytochromatia bacterium]|nr:vWA domain-containing protein [Candidatus Sericytochromatia bacterium]
MYSPDVSEVALPHFSELRRQCVMRMLQSPHALWTERDHAGMRQIASDYARRHKRKRREDWEFDPCIQAITRDVEDAVPPLPKWACLVAWLAPEGAVTFNPEIISKIALAALNNTLGKPQPSFGPAKSSFQKGAFNMPYAAEISRRSPTAFLFVIDQSGSMNDRWMETKTKAQALSDAINRVLMELVTKCSKEEGIRHYFDVGVIGYGGSGCRDALAFIPGGVLKSIQEIERQPMRVEDRTVKVPDGAGGIIEQSVKFPVWFEPVADGGTPMCAALSMAGNAIKEWADGHLQSFPPIVIHITDGEANDGDPEPTAELIKQLATYDGNVLLFNLHISGAAGMKVLFPSNEGDLPCADARRLFRMSSALPEQMLRAAQNAGYNGVSGTRGYGYNADFTDVVSFLTIGTRPANDAR